MSACTPVSSSCVYFVYLTGVVVSSVIDFSSAAPSHALRAVDVDEGKIYGNFHQSTLSSTAVNKNVPLGVVEEISALPSSASVTISKVPPGAYSSAGTRPNVMTVKQLAPTPMDTMEGMTSLVASASGHMPMMMPMPLTTALQSTMQKSMKGFNDFMMQMSMSLPDIGQHQSSPCASLGMTSPPFSPLTMPMSTGTGDIMSLLKQLTETLNPINFFNSILQMMKSTSMSMQSSMPDPGMMMMMGGCGSSGGD